MEIEFGILARNCIITDEVLKKYSENPDQFSFIVSSYNQNLVRLNISVDKLMKFVGKIIKAIYHKGYCLSSGHASLIHTLAEIPGFFSKFPKILSYLLTDLLSNSYEMNLACLEERKNFIYPVIRQLKIISDTITLLDCSTSISRGEKFYELCNFNRNVVENFEIVVPRCFDRVKDAIISLNDLNVFGVVRIVKKNIFCGISGFILHSFSEFEEYNYEILEEMFKIIKLLASIDNEFEVSLDLFGTSEIFDELRSKFNFDNL